MNLQLKKNFSIGLAVALLFGCGDGSDQSLLNANGAGTTAQPGATNGTTSTPVANGTAVTPPVVAVTNPATTTAPPATSGAGTPQPVPSADVFVKAALTKYVNPFVGTADSSKPATDPVPAGARGGTFPGATTPFGMVQWTPMTPSNGGQDHPVGYIYKEKTITGFPLTQMSGSGCDGNEGELPVMPTFDTSAVGVNAKENFDHKNEAARPGYYQVTLNDGINTELTATTRTGFGRFTFPAKSAIASANKTPYLVFDATRTNTIASTTGVIKTEGKDALSGSTVGGKFCGARTYTLYFYAKFDRNITAAISNGKASVTFDASTTPAVLMKVGLSYVSSDNARKNLEQENPGWDFNAVRDAADNAWNTRLNTIQVSGGSDTEKRKFYTALYHSLLSPNTNSDVSGDYIGFDQKVHQVEAGRTQYVNYSNWDVYRSLIPLTSMLFPKETSDMMQSLVNDADQCGAIPRWAPINVDAGIMPGDSGVPTIMGGYAFGATGFDAKKALEYMTLVGNKADVQCTGDHVRDSTDRMNDYLVHGYAGMDNGWWAGSLTFEFGTADFATSQLAKALGDNMNYQLFLSRSANWKNQFNPTQKQLLPRYRNGSWLLNPQPNADMVEGNAEQYTWMSAYDARGLFGLIGGNDATIKRLDAFFQDLNAGMNKPNFYMGNEPSFATPWLYNWTGAPWRTQKVVRDVANTVFSDDPGGLPGNDDLGAVSSWYVWAALGLYPEIQAVSGLTIGSPMFDKVVVRWADGAKKLVINASGAATNSPYIQSLALNGQALDMPWLWLKDLKESATLDFSLAASQSQWGKDSSAKMPSFGLDGFGSLADALNNRGIGTDGQKTVRGLEGYTYDMGGWSYSSKALATAGATAGGNVSFNGVSFAWPDGKSGLDNMVTQGQVITFAKPQAADKLALLGSSTNASTAPTGKLIVTYTDDTQASFDLRFDDWTLGGGGGKVGSYNQIALTSAYRVDQNGNADTTKAYVFYWDAQLDKKRTVKSVTLPYQTDNGALMHVFAMTLK
ncbi:MAG: Alpha,2-mannosidase [Collimonas fungivorans]|uniref:GH92 family glycosyl hydrolase n=1 Tax=Collimonas fungivorans TaxID=158899 RepID=UPI0026EA9159|nr:GH92 family glycosyl hydrolase [Collimonas fungivorans]MDB5766984.1 Alpha,2-mannosidase [Collimonas fungivorans]